MATSASPTPESPTLPRSPTQIIGSGSSAGGSHHTASRTSSNLAHHQWKSHASSSLSQHSFENNAASASYLASQAQTSTGRQAGSEENHDAAGIASKLSEQSLRERLFNEQIRRRHAGEALKSPLLECVKTPVSPALPTAYSLPESSSSYSFAARTPSSDNRRQEKDLPRLPSNTSIDDSDVGLQLSQQHYDESSQRGGLRYGSLSPRAMQAQTSSTFGRFARAKTPKRLAKADAEAGRLQLDSESPRSRFALPLSKQSPSLSPYNSSEAGPSRLPDEAWDDGAIDTNGVTSPTWLERSRVKSAGQSAGAGLRKLGKASAARFKQAQQSRPLARENGAIIGMWNRSTSNLRRYEGSRGAKSASDLTLQSVEFSEIPPPVPALVLPTIPDPNIGLPTDVRHNVHVDVGPRGYTGLPESWAQVLVQFGFNAEEVRRNPQNAANLVRQQTQYFVDREAERGRSPENTRRLLASKLFEFEDLRQAVHATAEATGDNDDAYAAFAQLLQSDTDQPARDSFSMGHAAVGQSAYPAKPLARVLHTSDLPSPSLPQVESQDEDWAASLLQSLPMTSLMSKDANNDFSRDSSVPSGEMLESAPQSIDNVRRIASDLNKRTTFDNDTGSDAEELRDHGSVTAYEEESAIMTASKIAAAKITRGAHLLPHASETETAARPSIRRGSESSTVGSSHSHAGSKSGISGAPIAWSTSRSAQSVADQMTGSAPETTQQYYDSAASPRIASLDSSARPRNPGPAIVVATPPLRDRASSDSHLTSSDQEQHLSTGLRERRRAHPRVYPPSAHRLPRDSDTTSAIGFKRPGSSGRPTSSQGTHQDSPLLRGESFAGTEDSLRIHAASAQNSMDHFVRTQSSAGSLRIFTNPPSVGEGPRRRPSQSSFTGGNASFMGTVDAQGELATADMSATLHKQHVPEYIRPDVNGFYKAPTPPMSAHSPSPRFRASLESSSQSSPMLAPALGAQYLAENGSGNVFRSSANTFAAASPLGSQYGSRASISSSSADAAANGNRSSQGASTGAEDYQPASDFIDHWLQADGGSSRRASTATGSEDGTKEGSYSRSFRAREDVPDVPPIPHILPALSTAVVPGKHQSPSPALLLGLPTLGQHSAQPLYMARPGKAFEEPVQDVQPRGSDHEILQEDANTQVLIPPLAGARDWRTRSLPPPPSEEDEDGNEVTGEGDLPTKRSSRSSLPDFEGIMDASGPPLADASVLEAVSLSRLSSRHSRQSRSSSRAGKRSQRRSADAKRFPVSMHYASGFDADALSLDRENGQSFSQLMRARQSFDLDDVMPSDLARQAVPPVPPIPQYAANGQHQVEDLPESARHLSGLVRLEKPDEALGEMVMIGEGESGDVYASIPQPSTRIASFRGRGKVAVKVVAIPEATGTASTLRLKNLQTELHLWRSVQPHEHIVTFFDAFVPWRDAALPGVWIVQEFMSISLADMIGLVSSGLNMTEQHMSRILCDVLKGLQHLHQCRVLHRDLRSDNVLLTFDGLAKISDFTHAASLTPQRPARNSVVGTAYWMAPEVVKAEDYTYKADIWSFGVVIYEMLEGSPPRVDLPALRAITLTAKLGLPALSSPQSSSTLLQRCMAWCTELQSSDRPDAEMLAASEYFARADSHAAMADLVEQARALECDIASTQDEDATGDA